ncbi:DUF2057 domain-containing protein [Shewanella sp. WXL01]|uniref:DUF2057 domain-containing protein n=1 Tax=Shewanella maritima TaxID=2520507 RepID=A0A411PG14_9GAMM|nr:MULTISPECIES: DUF2057 family protein [Shewanella]NKF49404.1 DUF2057 domain-containing protein [Shewanella sp. WXL01]QBF82485.1 DUF2057 domain-containing protein [Shewanella maritima]
MSIKNRMLSAVIVSALATISMGTQAASITTNEDLNIASINGQDVNFDRLVGLKAGETLIEVNYRDLFQDNADDSGHWVRSEPMYLKLDLVANSEYHIATPALYSAEDAHDFLDAPQVHLKVNGQAQQKVALMTQSQLLTELLID